MSVMTINIQQENDFRESLLGYLQTCIKMLTSDYITTKKSITHEHTGIGLLYDALMRIFSQGKLKDRRLWHLFQTLQTVSWISPQIKWLDNNLSTDEKKINSFIFWALNSKNFSQCLSKFSTDAITFFYDRSAILFREDDREIFFGLCSTLDSLEFSLLTNENLQINAKVAINPVNENQPKTPKKSKKRFIVLE